MRYWLFMFRPDTYERVKGHETIGVRDGVRKRFQAIAKGDRFLTYVSRAQLLDGHGEVTSDPCTEDTLIFADDQIYQHRVRVRFDRVDARKPVGDVLWGLSPFQGTMRTTPTNLILCKGGFIELNEADYRTVANWLDGKSESPWPPSPGRRR